MGGSPRDFRRSQMDILIALLVLFALALITVIGHGIWVLLAMIYHVFAGGPESQSNSINANSINANSINANSINANSMNDRSATRTRHDAQCAECGEVLQIDDSFCHVCGRPRSGVGLMAELATTAR